MRRKFCSDQSMWYNYVETAYTLMGCLRMNKNGNMVGNKAVNERLQYLTKKVSFPYNRAKNAENYSSTKC